MGHTLHVFFFFSSRRRHTSSDRDWSSDVCSSDLSWSARKVSRPSRSSQMTRSAHRRLSRSRRAMIGRPVREPRTGRPGLGVLAIARLPLCYVNSSGRMSATEMIARHSRRTDAMIQARIAPLEPPYSPPVQAAVDRIMPKGVPPLALFRTLAVNERVFLRVMAGGLLDRGSISLREREIVIDRTCARCGSEYEWGVHVAFFAERVGLTPERVAATCGAEASA